MNDFQYAYQSDFNNTPNTINQSLLIIGGAIITGILIALIFILQSIALMKLAKRNNINHSWVLLFLLQTLIYSVKSRLKTKLKLLYS